MKENILNTIIINERVTSDSLGKLSIVSLLCYCDRFVLHIMKRWVFELNIYLEIIYKFCISLINLVTFLYEKYVNQTGLKYTQKFINNQIKIDNVFIMIKLIGVFVR